MSWPATGALRPEARRSLAPGDDLQTHPRHAVPTLRCFEHASTSMQSSKPEWWETSSPRCSNIQKQSVRPSRRCETKLRLSGMKVPGTSLSNIMTGRRVPGTLLSIATHAPQATTSDMCSYACLDRNMPGMKAHLMCHRDMPGMRHKHSLFCICSHVGYNKSSRLATCPAQCAHVRFGRFETCPGQCAHSSNSRSATCPGQSAQSRYSRLETCPGQRAPELYSRNQTCSEQLCSRHHTCSEQLASPNRSTCPGQPDQMAQSRERTASLNEELAELKFWTYSIGCKNLRDCLEKVPASWKSFDVPQSDWWTEPGISKRREALRELTTIDIAHVVDTRCLRDM